MPSKSNKRKAAAERSAALAAALAAAGKTPENTAGDQEASHQDPAPSIVAAPTTPVQDSLAADVSSLSIASSSSARQLSPVREVSEKVKVPIEFKPPARLAPLTKNHQLSVLTNSFELTITPKIVHRYDVIVNKYIDGYTSNPIILTGTEGGSRQRQADLFEIFQIVADRIGLENCPYDGASTLYTTRRLEQTIPKFKTLMPIMIEYDDLSDTLRAQNFRPRTTGHFEVTIEHNERQGELNTSNLLSDNPEISLPVVQMLQIALVTKAKRNSFVVAENGSEIFNRNQVRIVSGKKGVIKMPGVAAGIKIAIGRGGKGAGHIVVDSKNKEFFQEGPLEDIIDFQAPRNDMENHLKGLRVSTTYSTQQFTIDRVSKEKVNDVVFPDGGRLLDTSATLAGRDISFFNGNYPAIQTSLKNKDGKFQIYSWPIENLNVVPNQALKPQHGGPPRSVPPYERFNCIRDIGRAAHIFGTNEILKDFGVTVNPEPLSVSASKVFAPKIAYSNIDGVDIDLGKRASWRMKKCYNGKGGFIEPMRIQEILILYNTSAISGPFDLEKAVKALETNLRSNSSYGVTIRSIRKEDLARTYPSLTVIQAIERKMDSLRGQGSKLMVMYADNTSCDKDTHKILKLKERQCGIVTQQVGLDKSLKNLSSGGDTLTNIFLKLNLKAGGHNHNVIVSPSIAHLWGNMSNTLYISYDVCHSSGRIYKKGELCDEPSCVGFGFNGTRNPEAIIGDFHYQLPRKEQVDDEVLKERTATILKQYINARKKFPEYVIVLRDGVSEGQYKMVRSEEFPVIQKTVLEIFNTYKKREPSFALLIVTKRHANRLVVKNGNQILNVSPLTAIDDVIVRKTGNEIIFVSHCPINGTAQPIVINMLYNESVFKTNDSLVQLMAALCCAHQSSTCIVSLPETIYAADEYAKRGADLFKCYKASIGGVLPTIAIGNGNSQVDYSAVTKTLSYNTSDIFRCRRIA